jgi:hypothetical protein
MKVHVLVEGPSEEAALRPWLVRFLPGHRFQIIRHRGKGRLPGDPLCSVDPKRQGLLDQLPAKLRAYGQTLNTSTDRVLVLVDVDNDNCKDLLGRLRRVVGSCDPRPEVLFRLAIEEFEAFYLGDADAIRSAFPRANLRLLKNYKQDSICGTWEVFQKVVGARSESKVAWADAMGAHLGTSYRGRGANQSLSFRKFCEGLMKLCGEAT